MPPANVNALLVREEDPPKGATPVEWLLLTTLPCDTLKAALQVLTWYTYRWRIERYHFILKSAGSFVIAGIGNRYFTFSTQK